MKKGCKHHADLKIMCIDHFNTKLAGKHNKNIKKRYFVPPPLSYCDVIKGGGDRKGSTFRLDDTPHSILHTISFQKI